MSFASLNFDKPHGMVERILRVVRLNILFIAIGFGMSVYFLFHYVDFLQPVKYPIKHMADTLVPYLIFTMLFLAFSKIELKKMRPRRWHLILLVIQLTTPLLFGLYLMLNPESAARVEIEGIIVCIITPTAAAASIITGKLGGDETGITTFTILSNLGAAFSIPVIFPLFSASAAESTFMHDFLLIMARVFPMIVLPLISAHLIRVFLPKLNLFIRTRLKEVSFYIWAFTLSTISATATSNLFNSQESTMTLINLALVGLVLTALQFMIGKFFGHREGQRISGGQGMGQKNMVFGIWIAVTYLSPASSIAPGCYILWQNIVNSWQLWYRDKTHSTYQDKM